jgi:hypothetical protein
LYIVTPAVNASVQSGDNHPSADLVIAVINLPTSYTRTAVEQVADLNTGPPPDNLVVELHRFLI